MQDLIVNDCSKIKVSGVEDITFFDEKEILLDTTKGGLVVYGAEMKIGGFDSVKKEVEIRGQFRGCEYFEDKKTVKAGKESKARNAGKIGRTGKIRRAKL